MSTGRVSFIFHDVMIVRYIPKSPVKMNTPIHEVKDVTALPASGESNGVTLVIIVRRAKNLVSSTPLYRSRTIAREMTSPAAATLTFEKIKRSD